MNAIFNSESDSLTEIARKKKFQQKIRPMLFTTPRTLFCQIFRTGRISNTSSIGRIAKMFRSEVLEKNHKFEFHAFGDNLIGRTIKAFSIAQNSPFDNTSFEIPKDHKLVFMPFSFETPSKRLSDIPSIRFLINCGARELKEARDSTIKVSSSSLSDEIAERMHQLYLKKSKDHFVLRCVGDNQASTVVQALAKFNENVDSHKLSAWISNELVHDTRKVEGRMLRVIQFHVDVVGKDFVSMP
jgi:hypothetical protein